MRSIAAALTGGGWVVSCLVCASAQADRLDDVIAQINKAGPPAITSADEARDDSTPPADPPPPVRRVVAQDDDVPARTQRRDPDVPIVVGHSVVYPDTPQPDCTPPVRYHSTERDPAWIGSVGLRTGPLVIDGVSNAGWTTELVLQAGIHLDRFTVLGEYGGSLVHHDAATEGALPATSVTSSLPPVNDQTTDGIMHRVGLYGRYALARGMSQLDAPNGHQTIGELYVQLGGGMEIIQWDLGGRLVRPELSAAIGLLGAKRSGAHSRHGMFADVRFQVARRIDRDNAEPTCAAPCTQATPPVAWSDRSILLEGGFVFGR
jgi:hypothetical protein